MLFFLEFVASFQFCRMIAKCSREETYRFPEALTSSGRLIPPAFGMRFWYIMRLDRLSQG
jgi:hypothetical protein